MSDNDNNSSDLNIGSVENDQEDRCFRRERYLRATANLVGKKCTFELHGGSALTGIFRGADIEFNNILVDSIEGNLVKPSSIILRSTDIITMFFDNIAV